MTGEEFDRLETAAEAQLTAMSQTLTAVEVFHDKFAADLPYHVVCALQNILGTEHLEKCQSCLMPKYNVVDLYCAQCGAEELF